MASTLLRSVARSTAVKTSSSFLRRSLTSTATRLAEPVPAAESAQTLGAKNVFDYHTVEDLQGMHASQILAETGSRADAKMRHFTGETANSLLLQACSPVISSQLWVRLAQF